MKPFSQTLEWNEPFARWFGDGELNVSVNCLDRHVRAGEGRQDRLLLRRRARRPPDDHLPRTARRRLPLRQRLAQARHQERRSRRDLHADDSGTSGRDARLRAHRRGALGDLRRLLARIDRRSRQRRAVRRAHHRRLGLAARQQSSAQTQLRHRDGTDAVDPALHRRASASATRSSCTKAATTGGARSSPASRRRASPRR